MQGRFLTINAQVRRRHGHETGRWEPSQFRVLSRVTQEGTLACLPAYPHRETAFWEAWRSLSGSRKASANGG